MLRYPSVQDASDVPPHHYLFAGCLALLSAIVHQLLDKRRCSAQSNPIIGICCFAWLAVDVIQVPGVNPTTYCSQQFAHKCWLNRSATSELVTAQFSMHNLNCSRLSGFRMRCFEGRLAVLWQCSTLLYLAIPFGKIGKLSSGVASVLQLV